MTAAYGIGFLGAALDDVVPSLLEGGDIDVLSVL